LTRVTASYLSDSVFGGHVDIGRRFGENKEFGVRFNGSYRNGNTTLDFQSLEEFLGSLALDYRGERLRVSVDLMYQQQNVDRVTRQFSAGATLAEIPHAPDGRTNYPGFGYSNMKDRSEITRGEYDVTDNVTVYGGYGIRSSRMDAVAGNPVLSNLNGNFEASPAW
jgi:iron complex outermembrane recepter protein